MKFEELNILPEIVKALNEDDIVKATDIQQKTIPIANEGKDVIGISRTGSGKTVAFSIPIIQRVVLGDGVQGLIIAPTRELVVQIAKEFEKFSKYQKIKIVSVYGGVSIDPQIRKISQSEIVVGTPGRLLDHLQRGTLDLSKLKVFVLDEADKMVEMGFVEDIEKILNLTNPKRQILLFGATISYEIENIKKTYMNNPVECKAELKVKDDLLKQYYYNVYNNQKFSLLVHLLKKEDIDRAIVFCSKRSTVDLLHFNLKKQNITVAKIHGKMNQSKRLSVIEGFNKGKPKILIASAVGARGLHIENVTHVFNYDLSQDPQEYVHRVGRTARAGGTGIAISLIADTDYDAFRNILGRYNIEVEELPDEKFERLKFVRQDNNQRRGRNSFQRGKNSRGGYNRKRN